MSAISYQQAKGLVLARLQQTLNAIPVAERAMPRMVIGNRALSLLDLIREVQMESQIGRSYVYSQISGLGYVIR